MANIGDLERYKEVNKVPRPKFNKGMFPDAQVREGRRRRRIDSSIGRDGNATCLHRHHQYGAQQIGTTSCGQRLARGVSSYLHSILY